MNKAPKLRLGIDLGGTKTEVALLDQQGLVLERERLPTPQGDYPGTLNTIQQLIGRLEARHTLNGLALGIATPGSPSSIDGHMKNCNSICLNGKPLLTDLEQKLRRPVRLANDADCFALAEAHNGAAQEANSVFGVILGTGVGGGLVINKRLLQGPNHICGEWGHNPVALNALQPNAAFKPESLSAYEQERPCYCGKTNCVETWLSGPALSQSDWELGGKHHKRPAREIASASQAGESQASQAINHYTHILASALATVINIIDPEVIVLGGGLSKIDSLYEQLPDVLTPYVFSDEILNRIVPAQQGDSAGVIGAAYLWG
ncbi:ROK family protein [Pseudoteredinibacter isoporae]|uniref:Putative NBD/HSP70 family sugar kinase n=1 Tax=Pseudoteredinibacter isoporae TaxID=570281 RepID=A0A7X0MYH3_9GAMM|nr:ROK family protein [Pseudoteredinibacter isoporae]MBB6522017.1 putative NBD/HSP70 family sugar kinase [Pseudoteredinibacter isoporae]NHO87553.1 ROK family protein [Pseudoteredinibacter isoporae]NIB24116.1 ROK family protein [Pseudoteredinibacter isoporae]